MKFIVDGMTCTHCVRAITRAIQSVAPGVDVKVDLATRTVTTAGDMDPGIATAAIEAEGYTVLAVGEGIATSSEGPTAPARCCGG